MRLSSKKDQHAVKVVEEDDEQTAPKEECRTDDTQERRQKNFHFSLPLESITTAHGPMEKAFLLFQRDDARIDAGFS